MKKWIIRSVVIVAVLVVAGLAVLYFSLNTVVKRGVETVGPYLTKTEVKLDSVNLSPFSGQGELKGFVVGNPQGYNTPSALQIGTLAVAVDVSSIRSDKIVVKSIVIDAPEVTLEGGIINENNLTKILANIEAASGSSKTKPGEKSSEAEKKASRKIQVDDLVLRNVKVHVALLGGTAAPVAIPDIHLTHLGTGSDGITIAEAAQRVFKEILGAVLPAARDAATKLGKNLEGTVRDLTKDPASGVEKAAKGITDMFKKK
jgi:hypothetical protein